MQQQLVAQGTKVAEMRQGVAEDEAPQRSPAAGDILIARCLPQYHHSGPLDARLSILQRISLHQLPNSSACNSGPLSTSTGFGRSRLLCLPIAGRPAPHQYFLYT